MTEILKGMLPPTAEIVSLLLMGACGVQLLGRLIRVLRGQEAAKACGHVRRKTPMRGILLAMAAALLSRLAVYVIGWGMYRALGGEGGLLQTLKPLWIRWDTAHYLGIAEQGYTAVGDERLRLVFFPLYPLLMRLLAPLAGGDVFYAGLLISLLCASACAGLLYALAQDVFGRRTAALAVAYFLLSPLSVFLCCAYTEALFICLTLAAILLYRRGYPWLAAVCGMLSAFTRMPGVIVSGLFIIGAIGRFGEGKLRKRDALACAAQVGVVFLGLAAYWLVNYAVTGDPMTYLTYQRENWFQEPGSFWRTAENTAYYFVHTVGASDWLYTWGFQLLCIFYVMALLAVGQGRLPFDFAAYSFVYTAVVLAPTWLLSGARYLYALAPLPLLKARMHRSVFMHALALTLSAVLLLIWIYGYTIAVEVL